MNKNATIDLSEHEAVIDKHIEFFVINGEVLSQEKRTETHVSGGGGHTGSHMGFDGTTKVSGYTAPVTSNVITKFDFWIKTEDGMEKCFNLQNVQMSLREGQKISILLFRPKGSDGNASILSIYNYNADQTTKFPTPSGKELQKICSIYINVQWKWFYYPATAIVVIMILEAIGVMRSGPFEGLGSFLVVCSLLVGWFFDKAMRDIALDLYVDQLVKSGTEFLHENAHS